MDSVLTKPLVVDGLLGDTNFKVIQNIVLGENFDWYFHDAAHLENTPNKKYPIELHGFTHVAYSQDNQSNYLSLFQPIVYAMVDALELTSYELIRLKLNLTLNVGKQVEPQKHTDYLNGFTALYYLNDCDGDTLFYENDVISYRQTPKENCLVIFNSNTFHSGQLPLVSTKRYVVNINITGI